MGSNPTNPTMEVLQSLAISDEAASQIAGELSDDYGIVKDRTWGNGYFLVMWHDSENEE